MEFEIKGQKYKAAKLSAFQQLHVSRKLAPIIPKLLPAFVIIAGKEESDHVAVEELGSMADALAPAAQALAEMTEADAEFVYGTCMSVVSRLQGNVWSNIWNVQSKTSMFDDIDLSVMTQIVFNVIGDSLGNFIRELFAKTKSSSEQSAA